MNEVLMTRSGGTGYRLAPLVLFLVLGCRGPQSRCDDCGTVVVAAVSEPSSLVPPLVVETVGRDISDQNFERLAVLRPGAAPIDPAANPPGLAQSLIHKSEPTRTL
jgi:hypothetical protein